MMSVNIEEGGVYSYLYGLKIYPFMERSCLNNVLISSNLTRI